MTSHESHRRSSESTAQPVADSFPILTRFNQEFFCERLNHVVLQTNHYDDSLPAAWQKVQEENRSRTALLAPDASVSENGNGSESMQHICQLLQRIRNAGITSVVLEAAHAYAYQSMGDADFVRSMERQYAEAHKLTNLLEENRIHVQRVLFIDNYNPNPVSGQRENNLDVEAYKSLAAENGFPPDYLIWEADMAPIAKVMIDFMRDYQSLIVETVSGAAGDMESLATSTETRLHLDHRKVEMFSVEKDKVSCAALDAALSMMKLKYLGQGIVNVLPKNQHNGEFSFRGQQKKVRQILSDHLGVRIMPFFNLFTSEVDHTSHSSGAHNDFRKRQHRI